MNVNGNQKQSEMEARTTHVVMCNNNRKRGVCKQTGAFVSNHNKIKYTKKKRKRTTRQDEEKIARLENE